MYNISYHSIVQDCSHKFMTRNAVKLHNSKALMIIFRLYLESIQTYEYA